MSHKKQPHAQHRDTRKEKMSALNISEETKIIGCTNCKAVCTIPIRCPTCSSMNYCTEECRDAHWKSKHHLQCKSMLLAKSGSAKYRVEQSPGNVYGKICVANEDIQPGEKLVAEYPLAAVIFHTDEQIKKMSDDKIDALFGSRGLLDRIFFPYDSEELIPEEEMKSSEDGSEMNMRPVGKLLSILAKKHPYIGKANFFHTTLTGSQKDVDLIECIRKWINDKDLEPRTISMIMGIIMTNVHQMCPMLSANGIALGFFAATSMFNHSCNPNADMIYSKGRVYVHTNTLVRANEEITVDYLGGKACISGRAERQKVLFIYNNFRCRCPQCRCSQDFVLESWTASACKDESLKNKLTIELRDLYLAKKYDEYIRGACELWENNAEVIITMPYTLFNMAHTLSVATVMTSRNQYDNIRMQTYKILSYCLSRMTEDKGLNTLIDGTTRSLQRLRDTYCAAITIVYAKPLLKQTVHMEEPEAKAFIDDHFKTNPKERDLYRSLMGPSLSWLYSRPMKMEVMFPDLAVNSLLTHHYLIIDCLMKTP